jgi:rubrerythrin
MEKSLTKTLKENGWIEVKEDWEYRKKNWIVLRDTSSWWMVGTNSNPRVFDVHEPMEYESKWTTELIEHLCKMEDERTRLRKCLEYIESSTNETHTSELSKKILEECYHTWLVINNKLHCPVCNSTKEKE